MARGKDTATSGQLGPLPQKIENNRQQAAILAVLRDILLRLIPGRLRVGQIARITEQSA